MSLHRTALTIICGALLALTPATALASSSHHRRGRTHSHHVRHHPRPRHHSSGIPQHNGGDRDGDNNGAPSDGDGSI